MFCGAGVVLEVFLIYRLKANSIEVILEEINQSTCSQPSRIRNPIVIIITCIEIYILVD